jgi:hypothetical protein
MSIFELHLTDSEHAYLVEVLIHNRVNGHSFDSVETKRLSRKGDKHRLKRLSVVEKNLFNKVYNAGVLFNG